MSVVADPPHTPPRGPLPPARLEAAHYEPPRVPLEVLRHSSVPDTLGVGRPGKVGLLELAFERVGDRTELVRHYQKSPLQIMRPLYFDPHRPDLPITFLMSTGGGVIQADRLRTDLSFGPGASGHVTTQAATKVYRMEHDYAVAQTFLTAGPDAYVEYLPDPVIPYVDSRFYQRTVITADPTATVLASETVLSGRLAHGERNAYQVFASDFELRRPGGELVALDTVRLEPGGAGRSDGSEGCSVDGPAVLAGRSVMACFFAVSPLAPARELADLLHEALAGRGLPYGVSVLPQDCGAWVRVLGEHTEPVTLALGAAWDAVRRRLIGVPAPDLRKT
ncbi:urease accessory protein UreD [Streptomyces sp. NBC_00335]|uniref:urease accessory protein UreD n=1 Tax=unclassified Streptomyces TaxID=2593676 RepID=UPI00225599A8|nr:MULTISPECIES: urease accessory protein UreD [unclassified Streptomyces]MCX5402944.1 urease accessory protein UreD [Streptomyces sp. NBC_00086]